MGQRAGLVLRDRADGLLDRPLCQPALAEAHGKAAQPAVTDQRERPVVEAGLEGLGDEARHLDRHP